MATLYKIDKDSESNAVLCDSTSLPGRKLLFLLLACSVLSFIGIYVSRAYEYPANVGALHAAHYRGNTGTLTISDGTSTVVENKNNNSLLTTKRYPLPSNKRAVLLVTAMRSGSSFVGEILNQCSDIFYIFEPLKSLMVEFKKHNNITSRSLTEKSIAVINDTLQCRIRLEYGHCLRSKVLTDMGLCNYNGTDKMKRFSDACRSRNVVAIKLIRLRDIAHLETLSNSLDLRIIHLVRDPRPTTLSRNKLGFKMSAEDLCEGILRNLQYWINPKPWMAGKYLLVRYEDVARNPVPQAMKILKFIGYPLPDNVKQWLGENVECNETANKDCKKPYETSRNSSAIFNEWRNHMNWTTAEGIQNGRCKIPMKLLGYTIFDTEEDMRNLSIEYVSRQI